MIRPDGVGEWVAALLTVVEGTVLEAAPVCGLEAGRVFDGVETIVAVAEPDGAGFTVAEVAGPGVGDAEIPGVEEGPLGEL